MYRCTLSKKFLDPNEIEVLEPCLGHYHIDSRIWPVFSGLFESKTPYTVPQVVRVYEDTGDEDVSSLCGATVIVTCKRYGRALYRNALMAAVANRISIPFHQWIAAGCCMDMMSCPVLARKPECAGAVHAAIAGFLGRNSLLAVAYDHSDRAGLYDRACVLPAIPHALIDIGGMTSVTDYTAQHRNIKRKISRFEKVGGTFELIQGQLGAKDIEQLQRCFKETSARSTFYLPYQDLYLDAATHITGKTLNGMYYFVARLNGDFLGYQAALATGSCLNGMHGAFDRARATTYHAYDILFVKMVEFAIERGLTLIDFGGVLNDTKMKMINRSVSMSYFLISRFSVVRLVMATFLKSTGIQDRRLMRYSINSPYRSECD